MPPRAKSRMQWFADRAAAAAAITGMMSAIFGVMWFFARNEVVTLFSELSGVAALTEEVRQHTTRTSSSVASIMAIAESNSAMIREFHPPKVAEYDEMLSRIFSPCQIGGECEAQLRIRRTSFGLPCDLPTVIGRFVTDKYGVEHPVQTPTRTIPTRLDGDWAVRPIVFIVPARVQVGIATFHLVLEYDCGAQGSYTEESPHLPFEAVHGG